MKRIFTITIITLALSSIANAQANRNAQADKHPVEKLFWSGIEAFNAHNLDEFMKQFADDIEMFTPTGWLRGKAAVRERFVSTFAQFSNVKMELEDLRVREVAPDAVTVDFRWKTYPQGRGPAFYGVGSGVYILRQGRWVEVLEHETTTRIDEELKTNRK